MFRHRNYKIQNFIISKFKISDFQNFKIQDFKIQFFKNQNFKISEFETNKISKFQNVKIQKFKISEFTNSKKRNKIQYFKILNVNIPKFQYSKLQIFKLHGLASILEYQKTWCCDKTNFIWQIRGNPLPESCVGLFTTLCTGRILKKRSKKIVFLQHRQQLKIELFFPINSPLTPDQPPL